MQNKHQKIFHFKVDQLPGRGGGPPVGPKDQLFPFFFEGSPTAEAAITISLITYQAKVSFKNTSDCQNYHSHYQHIQYPLVHLKSMF